MISPDTISDERGYFARVFDRSELEVRGIDASVVQANVSFNHLSGTLRGMHFQFPPHSESKLVRCVRGALYDVIIDLRPWSDTFTQHFGTSLTEENGRMLLVPRGFAHGYMTTEDATEAHYLVSESYAPGSEGGFRHDDPAFGIEWPSEVTRISEKDSSWPGFDKASWRWDSGPEDGL